MDRRRFLRGVVMAGAGAFAAPMLNFGRCRVFADDDIPGGGLLRSTRAVDLVRRATVIDMLGLLTLDWPRLTRWQREPGSFGEADFARLRASGIDVFHPAVDPNQPDAPAAVRRWLDGWQQLLATYPRYFRRIDTLDDAECAKAEGRIGLILGFQNSDHFDSVADVAEFYRLGQRVSQLTYNARNKLGSGCKAVDLGLSHFGADVVTVQLVGGIAQGVDGEAFQPAPALRTGGGVQVDVRVAEPLVDVAVPQSAGGRAAVIEQDVGVGVQVAQVGDQVDDAVERLVHQAGVHVRDGHVWNQPTYSPSGFQAGWMACSS